MLHLYGVVEAIKDLFDPWYIKHGLFSDFRGLLWFISFEYIIYIFFSQESIFYHYLYIGDFLFDCLLWLWLLCFVLSLHLVSFYCRHLFNRKLPFFCLPLRLKNFTISNLITLVRVYFHLSQVIFPLSILWRLLTVFFRVYPQLIIVGETRCATTTLSSYLMENNHVLGPFTPLLMPNLYGKECYYWIGDYFYCIHPYLYKCAFPMKWYLYAKQNFDIFDSILNIGKTRKYNKYDDSESSATRDKTSRNMKSKLQSKLQSKSKSNILVFDATPMYLVNPWIASRLFSCYMKYNDGILPKIVINIREPVSQNISWYIFDRTAQEWATHRMGLPSLHKQSLWDYMHDDNDININDDKNDSSNTDDDAKKKTEESKDSLMDNPPPLSTRSTGSTSSMSTESSEITVYDYSDSDSDENGDNGDDKKDGEYYRKLEQTNESIDTSIRFGYDNYKLDRLINCFDLSQCDKMKEMYKNAENMHYRQYFLNPKYVFTVNGNYSIISQMGCYINNIQRYEKYFGKNNIHIITFNDIKHNIDKVLIDLEDFINDNRKIELETKQGKFNKYYLKKYNQFHKPISLKFSHIAATQDKEQLNQARKINESLKIDKSAILSDEDLRQMAKFYKPYNLRLFKWLGKDLQWHKKCSYYYDQ